MLPAAGSLLLGAVMLIPASLALDHPWTLSPSAASIAALLGLSVLSTALAFTIYFRLLERLGSVGTTAQAYLRVPIGVGLGALVLGESLGATAALGLATILAGVVAMNLPGRERAEEGWTAARTTRP
jgi:drug/metabolite transporter (DMT)-like permease